MIKQLKYDFQYLFFTRKYRGLIMLTILLSIGLSILLHTLQGELTVNAPIEIFKQFRQLYWLLSIYVITDMISTDFHWKTFKNVLYKINNRAIYIISKICAASLFCLLLLIIHFISTWIFIRMASSRLTFNFFEIPYLLLGTIVALLVFSTFLFLVMILSEKETITISVAIGVILIIMLAEQMHPLLSFYLPTMQLITLEITMVSNKLISILVIFSYFLVSIFVFLGTIKLFRKKDVFI